MGSPLEHLLEALKQVECHGRDCSSKQLASVDSQRAGVVTHLCQQYEGFTFPASKKPDEKTIGKLNEAREQLHAVIAVLQRAAKVLPANNDPARKSVLTFGQAR